MIFNPICSAPPVVASIVLQPRSAELSERARGALLGADFVRVYINALNAAVADFPPASLSLILNNATTIYGIADCCRGVALVAWEKLIEATEFPHIETSRWTVRLLANDPSTWENRIALRDLKGAFCLASPIHVEAAAVA